MALIVLVVVIPLIYFLYNRRRKEKIITKGCEKHQLSKASWIKYDRHQMKLLRILTVVFGILAVLLWILVFGEIDVIIPC